MKYVMILIVCVFLVSVSHAQVEIYSAGQKYDTIEAYKAFRLIEKKPLVKTKEKKADVSVQVDSQQQDMVDQAAMRGIKVDPSKIKTVHIAPQDREEAAAIRKLKIISLNPDEQSGVLAHAQSWIKPQALLVRLIDSDNLEKAIRQAVSQSPSAKMIVSSKNAVNILSLSPNTTD